MLRPCESDDIYLAATTLVRSEVLRMQHLTILLEYGAKERPPDARVMREERDARLWDDALDRMTTTLRQKGIVE
ncbi:MAG: hypothetical protein VW268_07770 [Rhodospirillaceae bacterium]